jgi:hypothetical protein
MAKRRLNLMDTLADQRFVPQTVKATSPVGCVANQVQFVKALPHLSNAALMKNARFLKKHPTVLKLSALKNSRWGQRLKLGFGLQLG